jgi:hypothetical protein
LAALAIAGASSGCSICCTPWDYAYPAYGGKWERTDRFHGRVGSAFEPAGPFPADQDAALHDPESSALPPLPGSSEKPPAEIPNPNEQTPPQPESETAFEEVPGGAG